MGSDLRTSARDLLSLAHKVNGRLKGLIEKTKTVLFVQLLLVLLVYLSPSHVYYLSSHSYAWYMYNRLHEVVNRDRGRNGVDNCIQRKARRI